MKPVFTLLASFLIFFMHGCGGSGDNNGPVKLSIKENRTVVTTVTTIGTAPISYTLASDDDSALFVIDKETGKLKFKAAPNFEKPLDTDRDNIYTLTVIGTDDKDKTNEKRVQITVTDIDETLSGDNDGDHIPDNIEILINSDINNSDSNDNAVMDGLDSEGSLGDPFFDKQWHIRSLGAVTNETGIPSDPDNDLNLMDIYHTYMGYNRGENIIVQVVDTGVDADHEDLEENMDLSRSYDRGNVGDPSGINAHGTKVAGIIAARAFNGKGVRGIIPFAHIAGSNWLRSQSIEDLEKVWLSGAGADQIAVSNNSWGTDFDTSTEYEDIMALGSSTLRDGKGRIYVFAAGNSRKKNADANLQYILSNRYTITVAALKHDNTFADYSTPGSNILVSGYSGNYHYDSPTIGTTTIMGYSNNEGDLYDKTTWSEDSEENYTFQMNGTSAAAPMASASIALVLEACPDLTWRDIKYLTALHAQKVDTNNSSWIQNSAGLWHSRDYGFGLVNTEDMIADCRSGYTNLGPEQQILMYQEFNTTVTDDNTTYSFDLNTTEDLSVEWVEVTIDNDNFYSSDYQIALISPQGTKTVLVKENTYAGYRGWMRGGFRLSSAAFIDETSQGSWSIEMTDHVTGYSGILESIQIKIYGH